MAPGYGASVRPRPLTLPESDRLAGRAVVARGHSPVLFAFEDNVPERPGQGLPHALAGRPERAWRTILGVAVHERVKPSGQWLLLGSVARQLVEDPAEYVASGVLSGELPEPQPESREHTL